MLQRPACNAHCIVQLNLAGSLWHGLDQSNIGVQGVDIDTYHHWAGYKLDSCEVEYTLQWFDIMRRLSGLLTYCGVMK